MRWPCYSFFDVAGDVVLRYSLLGTDAYATITDLGGNVIGTEGEPIDPLLGPLADNGGFELPDGSHILTHALLPGSPAINAGDLNAVAGVDGVPEFDQRGEPFGRIVGGRIDIGAFEYQTPTDLNLLVDTLEDESDGDYSRGDLSLREAIELANANNYEGVVDTIRFDPVLTAGGPATILLTHGELAITDSLTINGPGADLLTIDAQQQSRILNVTATHGDFALACLTLTHGKTTGDGQAYGGGAIRSLSDGLLSVNESVVTGNCTTGDHSPGGGIYAVGGRLSLSHSKVEDNTTLGFYSMGGGIAHATGSLTVDSTTICGNQTFGELSFGGGVYGGNDRFGDVTFDDSVIAGNSTHGKRAFGGGLDVYRGTVLLNRTTVTGNSSASDGGGIFGTYGRAYSQSLMIVDSIISGNHAARSGGGIHSPASTYLGSGSVTLIRSVISENTADGIDPPNLTSGTGGGIYVRGDLRLVQTTVSGNTAVRGDGGGIFVSRSSYSGGKIEVDRSMLSGNVAISGNGGGIATETGVKMHQSNVVGNSAKLSGGGVYGSISADNCTVAENRAGLVLQR